MGHPLGYNSNNQMLSGTSYDANGDVLSDSLHSYQWNVETRPTTIDSISMTYDALGRIVEQGKSGVYTQTLYSPTGFAMQLMNGSSYVKDVVPMPGGTAEVWQASGNVQYYRHADWLGSSRFASTTGRTMYNDLAYTPFGIPYAQAGSTGVTQISFAGNDQDTTTNLYDAQFREYEIYGRWPSPDPTGIAANPANPQSWNRYAYVLNNPNSMTDPSGLDPCDKQENPGCPGIIQQTPWWLTLANWDQFSILTDFITLNFTGGIPVAVNLQTLNDLLNDPSDPPIGFRPDDSVFAWNDLEGWVGAGTYGLDQQIAVILAQQQNYFNYMQNNFGTQTSTGLTAAVARGTSIAGHAIPTVCGGGVFVYAGVEADTGGFGLLGEAGFNKGKFGASLNSYGEAGTNGAGAGTYTNGKNGTNYFAFVPVTEVGGVVFFNGGVGLYAGTEGPLGVGGGAYVNITSVSACR